MISPKAYQFARLHQIEALWSVGKRGDGRVGMRKVTVIGIGAGDPRHMTIQAIEALNAVDAVFLLDKGEEKVDLVHVREAICARFLTNPACRMVTAASPARDATVDYRAGVDAWHGEKSRLYASLIRDELGEDEAGAFLVWGDPALYDSTLRILDAIRENGAVAFETVVIPGISAAQALAAAHRIPLNRIGEPVHFTTGRKLRESMPLAADSVVFLDSGEALATIPAEDLHVWWGAYLGTGDEVLVSGPLAQVRDDILRLRREKRAAKGWIMDVYLLRSSDQASRGS
jgi:precorrin-6A synthase